MANTSALRVVAWLFGVPVVLALLLVGNYLFATRYLVRLETPRDPVAEIQRHLVPMSSALVFASEVRGGRDAGAAQRFLSTLGLTPDSLPATDEHLVPIDQVVRANPHPQPLDVVHGRSPQYLSFGYIGTDEQYHQVTYYWGEADTTLSLLVRKVRGEATGHGDHFVRYTVYLSKRLKPRPSTVEISTGRITGWSQPPAYPDVDRVDWSTYREGPYDGLEQIVFALGATCIEALLLGMLWRRRARRAARQARAAG